MEEQVMAPELKIVSTGTPTLDLALGVGGLPRGRLVELYGGSEQVRSNGAARMVASYQRDGQVCAWVDCRHTVDLRDVHDAGVDCSRMLLSQPDYGKQAWDVVEALVRSGEVGLIVVDSVAALVSTDESGEPAHAGLAARLMSRTMRKLASLAHQTEATVLFVHNEEDTLSTNALRFYATVRMRVRVRGATPEEGDAEPLPPLYVSVVKNKLSVPFRTADIEDWKRTQLVEMVRETESEVK